MQKRRRLQWEGLLFDVILRFACVLKELFIDDKNDCCYL